MTWLVVSGSDRRALMAGWERGPTKRGKLHLYAPPRPNQETT